MPLKNYPNGNVEIFLCADFFNNIYPFGDRLLIGATQFSHYSGLLCFYP